MKENIRKTPRLDTHDYSSECIYFVTICTEGRQYLLGSKTGDFISLSPIGRQVKKSWEKIGAMYIGITLGDFIVMPNHLHGIIKFTPVSSEAKIHSLFDIIRDFKSFTTHEYYEDKVRITGNLWQRGYHERVIGSDKQEIYCEYIAKNIVNWENDRFYELEQAFRRSM